MIRLTPLSARSFPVALALVAGSSCLSTAALAQSASAPSAAPTDPVGSPVPAAPATPPVPGDVIRLTEEQRMEILNSNTVERAAAARGELIGSGIGGRGIHGEVGAMIGSHGTRGIYGAAAVPLGDNAGVSVSFEASRFGYRR